MRIFVPLITILLLTGAPLPAQETTYRQGAWTSLGIGGAMDCGESIRGGGEAEIGQDGAMKFGAAAIVAHGIKHDIAGEDHLVAGYAFPGEMADGGRRGRK